MSSIAGKYNISMDLTPYQYEFTGNNRNALINKSAPDFVIAGALCSQINNASTSVRPRYDNVFTITRARLISSGAPGLRTPEGRIAGVINFTLIDENNTKDLSRVFLRIREWNEWEEINVDLFPFNTELIFNDEETKHALSYKIAYTATNFRVDDYNIQSVYIGQTFTPILQLEVKTSGMVNYDSIFNKYEIF